MAEPRDRFRRQAAAHDGEAKPKQESASAQISEVPAIVSGVRVAARVLAMAAAGALCLGGEAAPARKWVVARNSHFEVYSQAGAETARSALVWFEQLRALAEQNGMNAGNRGPVRVIGFQSPTEYEAYRLRPTADAYYIGGEIRDYIVMPELGANEFPIAAHEYCHAILHANGVELPPWLNEGLAEYFSTVRFGKHGWEIGGAIEPHMQLLRRKPWMDLERLVSMPADSRSKLGRGEDGLFYAESWALAQMLMSERDYSAHFAELVSAIRAGQPSAAAITTICRTSWSAVRKDLHAWVEGAKAKTMQVAGEAPGRAGFEESELSPFQARWLMADLLDASGEFSRAEAVYRELARDAPRNANVAVALATLALRKGDYETARRGFRQALEDDTADARLCYRYAVVAEAVGAAASDVRRALERAVALQPDFDDARYQLALTGSHEGDYAATVAHLQAMKNVAPERAYAYWSALAYAFSELGRRDDAKNAAENAMTHAATPAERANAAQLAYIAATDLTVQFTRDANGNPRLVTARAPHGAAWNPFIEPGDHIRRVEAQLENIECAENKITGIGLETENGPLKLAIPDPLHVLMRNAPPEFLCGTQAGKQVMVEYAVSEKGSGAAGVLRGMEFR